MVTHTLGLLQPPVAADWSRDEWIAYADRLLAGTRAFLSPGDARITMPGAPGGYGTDVDGLEGFARTFLLAGFRIVGARGDGVADLIAQYSRGIATGVDPDAPDRWVRLDEHPQAKVEAASLALVLDMTRPWIWDRLDALTQQRVIDYLSPVVGDDTYPRTNWLWFRVVVQTFLRSVGGPWSRADIEADLALHDSFIRENGWLSDGDERSYDHYVGWALHLYPVLWARMQGADELAGDRTAADTARLDRFLQDAIRLVGADGSPLIQGRSLVYRFAAAAAFWVGAIAEVPSLSAGTLRHAASAIVSHFAAHGVPDADDLLTLGWHGPWRRLAQNYSGTGSPYWAVKGLLGIALPADHPVWAAQAEPLPVTVADEVRAVRAPGWIISSTRADGIVRVVNHGTDHAHEGDSAGDSPLYGRLGYSTATTPLLNGDGWVEALEQSVALVDADGRATHRAGMRLIDARVRAGVGVAGSAAQAHWIAPAERQIRHGSGITGAVEAAGRITTWSIVRGPWEARFARVDHLASGVHAETLSLRTGGWAVSGESATSKTTERSATASVDGLVSRIHALTPAVATVAERTDASPLGPTSRVPLLTQPVAVGEWAVSAVALGASGAVGDPPRAVVSGDRVRITWADGAITDTTLTDPGTATRAAR